MKLTRVTGRVAQLAAHQSKALAKKGFATISLSLVSTTRSHRIVVIGGGSAGSNVSHQLLRSGKYKAGDIAVVDPAEWHHYQPGWTLVGGGLAKKDDFKLKLADIHDAKLTVYQNRVATFEPQESQVVLQNGDRLEYGQLVVCPGISTNYEKIRGLPEALADPSSNVSSIYSYDHCDKVFPNIKQLRGGRALFTQPLGILKCAGAPQKAMWLALDYWKRAGLYTGGGASPISISFATGLPVMFGVPKYSAKLKELAEERGVESLFQHDLVEVRGNQATFVRADGSRTTKTFDFLHAAPKMGPHAFVAKSPLADATGLVSVDAATLRHTAYDNVWALGDASSLPTSKTAAAITAQAPVLVSNLLDAEEGKAPRAAYDGYTSCPLITEYGKVLLTEFKYGPEPKETFKRLLGVDQIKPRRAFYHLKKDFFPWVYRNFMVKGTWAGPKGFIR
ncbi:pyridine nucleotide-disulfide oxidoreductase, putative [Cordyceps militaris CM01]|uniref:Pyridine nucleotide-disulfide oxidoreductase, putative n=1 Tax=Cordyceps militaris (strain CM01) TaxID=983644 RepID=G3JDV4_CORMM|nr:pyridine nucleotide-disulfide oxidoreductase, putative [Cordyceps militaris CM01]EGX92779.1 pyridine nucleotide-disulfide oxidoreductase, putative [Cordyceps militaris CM01]